MRGCSSNVVIAWSVDVKMQLSWRVRVQAYRFHREGAIAKNQPGGCAAGEDSRRGINGNGRLPFWKSLCCTIRQPRILQVWPSRRCTLRPPAPWPNIAHLYQRRDHQFGFEFSRRGSDLPLTGVFSILFAPARRCCIST